MYENLTDTHEAVEPMDEPLRLLSQANWIEFMASSGTDGHLGGGEYPLYSDAWIVGEISNDLGPYSLLNALPHPKSGNSAAISIILRAFVYKNQQFVFFENNKLKTNSENYHGGSLVEEIAALISLALGIRLKAGGAIRNFYLDDPLGRYDSSWTMNVPYLATQPGREVIPTPKQVSLSDASFRLQTIPKLDAPFYTSLIKAARLYQDALWLAESEPHLSWLLLVSALEIAANAHVDVRVNPKEALEEFQPTLATLLQSSGGDELLSSVSHQLKSLYSATKKFMLFCEEFAPSPPPTRPNDEYMRIDWEWAKLKKTLSTVYGLRSKALHAGSPFPAPMCMPPERRDSDAPAERAITALAAHTRGGQWVPEDAPITLHTFAYFVQGALLKWWDHQLSANVNATP